VQRVMFVWHRLNYRCCNHHDHHHNIRTLCVEHSVDVQPADTRSSQVVSQELTRLVKLSVPMFIRSRCQVSFGTTILTEMLRHSKRTLSDR
jgi:hypothetical protein